MQVYFFDKSTFALKHYEDALTYNCVFKSINEENTTITVKGKRGAVNAGDFVFVESNVWIVRNAEENDGILSLVCESALNLFDRDIATTPPAMGASLENYVQSIIQTEFKSNSDVIYAKPFINTKVNTNTTGATMPEVDNGAWNFKSYLETLRRINAIHVDFSVSNKKLLITIYKKPSVTKNIFLQLSSFEVVNETYSRNAVGKITTKIKDTETIKDWYLLTDGSITNTYTADNRVDGEWIYLEVANAEDEQEKVENEFAKNSDSHLIEFYSTEDFEFCDNLLIRTDKGVILKSYVSSISKSDTDDRKLYKSGELLTTLTEKLNNGGK